MTATERTSIADAASVSRGLGWLYVIGGGIGLLAAFALMLEKLATLASPGYVPTCTLNPVVSCGSVWTAPRPPRSASQAR